jgi:hypothetical protein
MFLFVTETTCTLPKTPHPRITYPISGFQIEWYISRDYQGPLDENNNFIRPVLFGAVCFNDADITGFDNIRQVTEEEWMTARDEEYQRRQPYPSWTFNPINLSWNPPVPFPNLKDITPGQRILWDEENLTWIIKDIT